MATSLPTSEDLERLLYTLPQELYDNIYGLVFTAEPGIRKITRAYKPPAQLQVSRATRKQFAKTYYSKQATFMVPRPAPLGIRPMNTVSQMVEDYAAWLTSLRLTKHQRSSCTHEICHPLHFRWDGAADKGGPHGGEIRHLHYLKLRMARQMKYGALAGRVRTKPVDDAEDFELRLVFDGCCPGHDET